jgi:hypothetical protein
LNHNYYPAAAADIVSERPLPEEVSMPEYAEVDLVEYP